MPPPKRYAEIDLARLLAMLMMATYHCAFDLQEYYAWPLAVREGWWLMLQRATLILFLLVSGVSATLMRRALHARGHANVIGAFWRRALRVLGAAMLVTIATYGFDPTTYVRFGVLHCIAVAWLMLPFLLPLGEAAAAIGLLCIGIAQLHGGIAGSSLLIPFGFPPPSFATVDYVPLLPWLGVILIGTAIGNFLYVRDHRGAWKMPEPLVTLSCPGRYALLFYLLHQPMILGLLRLILGPR